MAAERRLRRAPPPPPSPPPPPPRDLLAGKRVLITAAAGEGIGFATAERCLAEGAFVMMSDAHSKRLEEKAAQLKARAPHVFSHVCDITNEDDVRALISAAEGEMGHIDILINNAGLGGTAAIIDMSDEEWSKVMDVSLTGTFRMMRAVLPHMISRRQGVIVNNASVLGWRAQAGQAHYAAAKAGVMALTRCAALEVAAYEIRINAVAPSLVMHPFLARTAEKELLEALIEREAFKRSAAAWEVATVIAFLASDYASYMTGETIAVSSQHP